MYRHYSKYHAHRCEVDGIVFASKGEANRYLELKALEAVGAITNLSRQPKFELYVNDVYICTFIGDFRYIEKNRLREVIEDFKGFYTPESKLKHKLFIVLHPEFELRVIDRKGENHAGRLLKSKSKTRTRNPLKR